jgi:hypothetical protein
VATYVANIVGEERTVLQMGFAFLFLQKSLQNFYPTVWQMGFAFLLT